MFNFVNKINHKIKFFKVHVINFELNVNVFSLGDYYNFLKKIIKIKETNKFKLINSVFFKF